MMTVWQTGSEKETFHSIWNLSQSLMEASKREGETIATSTVDKNVSIVWRRKLYSFEAIKVFFFTAEAHTEIVKFAGNYWVINII